MYEVKSGRVRENSYHFKNMHCGGANWSLAPYGQKEGIYSHSTHRHLDNRELSTKRVSEFCSFPLLAMFSQSSDQPFGIPLSLPQHCICWCLVDADGIHEMENWGRQCEMMVYCLRKERSECLEDGRG